MSGEPPQGRTATDDAMAAPASPRPRASGPGWPLLAVAVVLAGLVSALVAVPVARNEAADVSTTTPEVTDGTESVEPVARVATALAPSIVQVNVVLPAGPAEGSAVVYRRDGYLVTNNHVVGEATQIEVVLPDGTTHTAELVGADAPSDLAVIRIEGDALPVPSFADRTPAVGDTAVAIGSPFGLTGSVTAGIVSAVGRSVPGSGLVDLLQTDAPINPGNSGGALADLHGEVIGINTAILSQTGENSGIGFAIPAATVVTTADEIISTGGVMHAYLGVQGLTVDPQVAQTYGLPVDQGAVVAAVADGSPAAAAGLERGDIITAVDGEPVTTAPELAGRILGHAPGDQVELTVIRGGSEQTVRVQLGESPTSGEAGPPPTTGGQ